MELESAAHQKNYNRWTPEWDEILRNDWGKRSAYLIGQDIGLSKQAVRARARRLALPFLQRRDPNQARKLGLKPEWSEEHAQFLRDSWGKISAAIIAVTVGRSRSAVIGKACRLGLPNLEKYEPTRITRAARAKPKPRAKSKPKVIDAPPIVDTEIPVEQRKRLLDLGPRDCRWPVGDPGTPGFFFCGGTKLGESSYCAAHLWRSINRQPSTGKPFVFRRAA